MLRVINFFIRGIYVPSIRVLHTVIRFTQRSISRDTSRNAARCGRRELFKLSLNSDHLFVFRAHCAIIILAPRHGMATTPSFKRESLMASSVGLFCPYLRGAPRRRLKRRATNVSGIPFRRLSSRGGVRFGPCARVFSVEQPYRLPAFLPYSTVSTL